MPKGGRLTIETGNAWLDQDYADQHFEVIPGQYVMIAVSDGGIGIPPENLTRVFDPFFTTKEVGKGTGLGLSMVYGFVKQSRGHVKIYSELGQGTTVRMYLPRADRQAESALAETDELRDFRGTETILLVEDDDLVGRQAEKQLEDLGYRVIRAASGVEAMEIIRVRPDIDLLFTDVVMPGGMNGRELADQAVKLRPVLKVLFTSGYTENAIVHQGRLDPGVILLNKPYRRIELARKVRLALYLPDR
jgi:CheY-like chemotaxis protein